MLAEVVRFNMSHLFSKENIDFTHEPLFLGSGRNVARLDLNIEQHIQKQVDDALGLMWCEMVTFILLNCLGLLVTRALIVGSK